MNFQEFITMIKGLPDDTVHDTNDIVTEESETDTYDIADDAYDARSDIAALRKETNDLFAQLTDSLATYISRGGIISDTGGSDTQVEDSNYFDRNDFSDLDV